MKLYPPIYPGESIFHPGPFPGGDIDGSWARAALRSFFVRSNRRAQAIPEIGFDVLAIEHRARAARSAWIAGELKSAFAALARRLKHPGEAV